MEDTEIVNLYWQRNESAIDETKTKYSHYLTKIAYNILENIEDSEESVNDTYLKAWNSMPPHRPGKLAAYLGKITRQLSIDIYRKRKSQKRAGSEYTVSLSELEDCVSHRNTPEQEIETEQMAKAISAYLRTLSEEGRNVFVCRYFFCDSIQAIAASSQSSQSKIKSMLYRIRIGLKEHLEKEGFMI